MPKAASAGKFGRSVMAFLWLIAFSLHPANSDPATEAWTALQSGDYETARALLVPLGEAGETWAQVNLGLMYAQGQGVDQNYETAMDWFRRAAEAGDATAQHCLGMMYEEGHGLSPNFSEAAKWYRLAANQGMVWAQRQLGLMYSRGQGVAQDYVQAHMWLSLAADAGDREAQMFRDAAAACMDRQQIEDANDLAREWQTEKPK